MCLTISEGIERYLNIHRASSSARTIEYYEENLEKFQDFIDERYLDNVFYLYDLTSDVFLDYVSHLRKRCIKNVSINTYTRAVRSWCSWLLDNNYIEKSFVKGVKKLRDDSAIVYPLTFADVRYIDDYLLTRTYGARDQIIFYLMLDCGLRRQEVINLNTDDVKERCLVIRNSKYNKSRLVPLPSFLGCCIEENCDLGSSGPLLLTRTGSRITEDVIRKMFSDIRNETHVKCYPHLLRHTFATSYVVGGGNLEFLRIILGHSSYNVTQKYLHVAMQCMLSDVDIYKLDKCFFRNYNNGGY